MLWIQLIEASRLKGEINVVRCPSHYARRLCCIFFALNVALILDLQFTAAQSLTGASPSGVQTQPDPCSGPMGNLIPECQTGKIPIDLPLNSRSRLPASAQKAAADSPEESRSSRTELAGPAIVQRSAPEPPSEFQRFVASSVGRILPIFGASLFDKVPTTFAPLDRVPVTAEYVIGPGDEILLRVWGQVTLDLRLTVDRAGAIYVPQVGSVAVSGIQFKQLPDYLRSQLERVFRNFDLSVNMGQLRSIQIFVMGNARQPGTYTVSSLSTLINALFESGGPSAQGSMRRIQLKRGAKVMAEFDLYDLLLWGDKSGDVRLQPEDVVYIPPAGPQVAAAGSLKNPAVYELKNEKTVGELIRMTGGLSALADRQRATLERIKNGSYREMLELPLGSDGINTPIFDGDVLQVLAILPRFDNAVTLRGNVANPGRFAWRTGMRLRDIIPNREWLITREYWKKRNLLGYTPQEELIAEEPAKEAHHVPSTTHVDGDMPDINWSYAVIERQNPNSLSAELIPFHLGKLIQENDTGQNLELRSGDVVTIFSQADFQVPKYQQTRKVRLEGEFQSAGVYNVEPGETLGQIIKKAGGLTPQAYLFGAEFIRESTRRSQQERLEKYVQLLEAEVENAARNRLGTASSSEESAKLTSEVQVQQQMVQRLRTLKATGRIVLSLDPGSNDISKIADIALEDGDMFVIPSQPATVNVIGAVYNPNSFIHVSKRSVSEYVRQAGGITRSADKGRLYIIRADGSVLPKQYASGFEKIRLNPGDSVVVPEIVMKTPFLAGLRNWSQILGQFGLGAAAINVLR